MPSERLAPLELIGRVYAPRTPPGGGCRWSCWHTASSGAAPTTPPARPRWTGRAGAASRASTASAATTTWAAPWRPAGMVVVSVSANGVNAGEIGEIADRARGVARLPAPADVAQLVERRRTARSAGAFTDARHRPTGRPGLPRAVDLQRRRAPGPLPRRPRRDVGRRGQAPRPGAGRACGSARSSASPRPARRSWTARPPGPGLPGPGDDVDRRLRRHRRRLLQPARPARREPGEHRDHRARRQPQQPQRPLVRAQRTARRRGRRRAPERPPRSVLRRIRRLASPSRHWATTPSGGSSRSTSRPSSPATCRVPPGTTASSPGPASRPGR